MTDKKTNEPSGWNPVFEFPLDDRNTIIIDGVKYEKVKPPEPTTLFNKLEEWVIVENLMRNKYDIMDHILNTVKEWISQYSCETNKWDEDYKCGYMDALDVLKKGLG